MDLNLRAQKIKLAIFDVDGVLTDGQIYISNEGIESKMFNVQDGLGLKLLQKCGIQIAIISGLESKAVSMRLQNLGVTHIYQGIKDKLAVYEELLKKTNMVNEQVAYLGDDLLDLPLMRRVGVAVAVANARSIVKETAHWCTETKGGYGAVREFCDWLLQAQNNWQKAISFYE